MASWVLFAVAAVLLLGVSNYLFKELVVGIDAAGLKLDAVLPVLLALGLVFFAAAGWYLSATLKPPVSLLLTLFALVVISLLAVGLIFLSLKTGKAAVVTAMLGLSAVVVAILSFVLGGVRFSAQEMVGMALAVAAVVALAL